MLPSESDDDGLGIWAESTDGGTLYGHVGARSGFQAFAYYDPENQRSIITFGDSGIEVEYLVYEAWDLAEAAAG